MYTLTSTHQLNQPISFAQTKNGLNGRFSVSTKMKLDHTHYDDATPTVEEVEENNPQELNAKSKKKAKKVVYHCDDYIEVPGGTDSVTYTDEDGNNYEVSIDDLQYYDGDDGEIQYTSGKKQKSKLNLLGYNTKKVMQAMIAQQVKNRVYA